MYSNLTLAEFALRNLVNHFSQEASCFLNNSLCSPHQIYISPTAKCPLKCKYCDIWKQEFYDGFGLKKECELTLEEWKKVIIDLKRCFNPCFINVTGGEPFVRTDVVDIIKFASDLGISLKVTTNGFLIDKKIVEQCKDINFFCINFSLNSSNEKKEDYLKGIPSAYDRVIKAMEYFVALRKNYHKSFKIVINTLLTRHNLSEIMEILDYVRNGLADRVCFIALENNLGRPVDRFWYKTNELWPQDADNISNLLDRLIEEKKRGAPILFSVSHLQTLKTYFANPNAPELEKGGCRVGVTNLVIFPDGQVELCPYKEPIGNIKYSNISEIWNSQKAQFIRQQIKRCTQVCIGNCFRRWTLKEKIQLFTYFLSDSRARL